MQIVQSYPPASPPHRCVVGADFDLYLQFQFQFQFTHISTFPHFFPLYELRQTSSWSFHPLRQTLSSLSTSRLLSHQLQHNLLDTDPELDLQASRKSYPAIDVHTGRPTARRLNTAWPKARPRPQWSTRPMRSILFVSLDHSTLA